jgi:hypothetical protein
MGNFLSAASASDIDTSLAQFVVLPKTTALTTTTTPIHIEPYVSNKINFDILPYEVTKATAVDFLSPDTTLQIQGLANVADHRIGQCIIFGKVHPQRITHGAAIIVGRPRINAYNTQPVPKSTTSEFQHMAYWIVPVNSVNKTNAMVAEIYQQNGAIRVTILYAWENVTCSTSVSWTEFRNPDSSKMDADIIPMVICARQRFLNEYPTYNLFSFDQQQQFIH